MISFFVIFTVCLCVIYEIDCLDLISMMVLRYAIDNEMVDTVMSRLCNEPIDGNTHIIPLKI